MKKKVFAGVAIYVLMILSGWSLAEETQVPLTDGVCVNCHSKEVSDINNRGARHKSDVKCLDCHLEHPPDGKNAIPTCAMCHEPREKAHYELGNCETCHHPHYPLEMDLTKIDPAKPACSSCHMKESWELNDYPSKHSDLDCNECHLEHRKYLECMECHEPHTQEMTYKDCLLCHKPHMASVVKYGGDVPSSYCRGCHANEFDAIGQSTLKHHDLQCVYCHKDQHKMVPNCEDCHGRPHSSDIHEKFAACLDCHHDAHGLIK
jgi:hypothetical protein